jgi:cell division ATPase FtsA
MSLPGKHKAQHDFVVITIDSGSVGIAVVYETLEDKVPVRKIIFSSRENIILPESITMESYLSATQTALTKILQALTLAKIKVPRDVHVVLSSPWQSSQTRFVSMSKEKTFKITEKVIHELMQKEEAVFVGVAKANPSLFGNDFTLFESKTMSATLNGYPIGEPIGKSAKTIELVLHLSVASQSALQSLTKTIQSEIGHAHVSFHSSVFTFFAQLRDIFPEVKSFLIIEIGEVLSEVTVVESSALSQSVSFPGGFHTQTETVAKELGRTQKEVAMYMRMYADGTLEQKLRHTLEDALQIATKNWATLFGQALSSLSKEVLVPDAIFLVTGATDTGWIAEAVKSEALQDYKIASHAFNFLTITPEHFNDFIKPAGGAGHDVPLELSALYVSTKA